MPRPRAKDVWTADADERHRYNGNGVKVITSMALDDLDRPIHLRLQLRRDPSRKIVAELTEAEAWKVVEDISSMLPDRARLTR